MELPQPSAWDWLAIDRAPQPPDLSQIGSPEALTAYLVGVEERMQRLALIVEAMRQSLAAGGLLTEAQLLLKVTELDLSDGVADGRNVAPVLQVCGKCGCSQTGQHRFCVRCGSDALRPAEGLSDP
jgi:ribosomal protein L40E